MTTQQLQDKINATIGRETDADRIADLEIAREYFTNPDFRTKLSDFVWKINQEHNC